MSGKKALEQFQKLFNSRDIISGIHNYCDRWCERCSYTNRCSVFAMNTEEDRIRKETNEPEKDLAEYVGSMLRDALELLHDLAREHGIDFDEIDEEEPEIRKKDKECYLVRKAGEHSKWLSKWFTANATLLSQVAEQLQSVSKDDLAVFNDAVEVLRWYLHFIAVKFSRASVKPPDNSPVGNNDSNGSAKIAIIAVNRSIEALALLLKFIPEQEDELLQGLVRLERIKKRALKDFPEAMSFKRPGLDT